MGIYIPTHMRFRALLEISAIEIFVLYRLYGFAIMRIMPFPRKISRARLKISEDAILTGDRRGGFAMVLFSPPSRAITRAFKDQH